jgi:hypothetical protein
MLKKYLLLVIFAASTSLLFAQANSISGSVKDTTTKSNLKNSVVVLLSPKDSILKAFTRVKADGSYVLNNVPSGKYILSVSHPNFGEYVEDITISNSTTSIPMVSLTSKMKLLEAVIVKSGNPIRIKGDTTIYTADSFKVSANANVEELLKKLPGIQVDKNGEIKAMGEKVEKVLVDGEEFFGDDPGMAVKNLRADAVKEVQVFDKKSEQAEFTGIDDGQTKKTINLKLKEDKKKGYFGKIDIGGGLNNQYGDRYNSNILLSSFKGKRKVSGFLLNGNTGQDGLSWQDEQKYGDNGNMVMDEESGFNFFSRNNGGTDEEPFVDARNGFITNVNAGLQYSNKVSDKTNLNFTPKYNEQRYVNNENTYNQNNVGNTAFNTTSSDANSVNRNNIKLKGIADLKLDSARTTLKITAFTNLYQTESSVFSTSSTNTLIGTKTAFANSFNRFTTLNTDKQAFGLNTVLKHKFKKARRTISLTTDLNILNSGGENTLKSENIFVDRFNSDIDTVNINQEKDFDRATTKITNKVVYTEPLSKKWALELGYQFIINKANNNQTTLNFNPATGKYEFKVDSLSNKFRQSIFENTPSAKVNYAHKKIKANVGAGVAFINFDLKDLSSSIAAKRNFTNFTPTASFNYAYKSNHNLSLTYRGTTRQPSINQLQPLRTNNDVFNQYIGNPNLRPSFTNNFSATHNGYNFIKDFWGYQSLNYSVTNNYIATNRVTDTVTGATVSQPINTNGNVNLNFWGGVGLKLKKLNTRVGFNGNAGYNKFVDLINNNKVATNNTNVGLSTYLQKSKDKKYDVSFSVGTNYNIQTTTQSNFKNKYLTFETGTDATVYLKKVWSLNAQYTLESRQKTVQAPGFTNNILNARLQRTFKKDEYTVYFLVRDLLNQNIGFERFFGQNASFTETRNDRLQRYWMIGFAWNFKNKAAAKK